MNNEFGEKKSEFQVGKINRMRVVKEVTFGVYLDGGAEWGEVLLPAKAVPAGTKPEAFVDVFIYFDSEDRLIATTLKPAAMVGDFAAMEVVDQNSIGAFLDWKIPGKDLLLPFGEQTRTLQNGERVVVYLRPDKQGGIVATMRFNKYISEDRGALKAWEKVSLLICQKTDMGYSAIINNRNKGLLYANEVFESLKEGDERVGYIKTLREDGKIDLTLHKIGYKKVEASLDPILEKLKICGGFIPVTDNSSPEEIYNLFSISKKTYKKSVGALFRQEIISIDPDGIRLV